MKKWLVTIPTCIVLFSFVAAEWYDPEEWLDKDERMVQAEWWQGTDASNGVSDWDHNIYGYDTGLSEDLDGWGFGYDYSTADWYEYNDSFDKWYKKDGGWF